MFNIDDMSKKDFKCFRFIYEFRNFFFNLFWLKVIFLVGSYIMLNRSGFYGIVFVDK